MQQAGEGDSVTPGREKTSRQGDCRAVSWRLACQSTRKPTVCVTGSSPWDQTLLRQTFAFLARPITQSFLVLLGQFSGWVHWQIGSQGHDPVLNLVANLAQLAIATISVQLAPLRVVQIPSTLVGVVDHPPGDRGHVAVPRPDGLI